MLRFLCLTTAFLLPAWAQPDAAALFQRSASALQSHRTYQYTEEMTTGGGMPGGFSMVTTVRGAAGKLRRDIKASGMDAGTLISDGQSTWIYMPMMKQYAKVQAGSSQEAAMLNDMDDMHTAAPGGFTAHAKVLRSESLEVDGQPHQCWVVESRPDSATAGGALHDALYTFWFDQVTGIDLEVTSSMRVPSPSGGDPVQVQSKTVKHAFQFDLAIDDAIFVFHPPEGATESSDLMSAFLPPAEKKESVEDKPAAPPAAGEPQAFIPNLNPIEETEPANSPHGVQGEVELLLTLDPAGHVARAEALTGPKELRQPAIDTVTQWNFRPVLRDGHPVFAYTTGMVLFGEPGTPDIRETMTFVQRTSELTAKYPRTSAQVLADQEQNLTGGNDLTRGSGLPELAKAAVKAGALDKAVSYANEMLQRTGDWNQGDEIYTANEVLGLVALRQDNPVKARQYLLDSAKTPGSPVLGSFGPDLQLAKELVQKGEKDTVLEFLEACRGFWKIGGPQIDSLKAKVRAGEPL